MAYKDKEKQNAWQRAYRKRNLAKYRIKQAQYYRNNPITYLLSVCRDRCRKKNLEFALKKADLFIPSHCEVLNIPLFHGTKPFHDNSPSIDRVIPERGYVKGNVKIISFRANKIKGNATLEELEKVCDYLRRELGKNQSDSSHNSEEENLAGTRL